MTRRAGAGQAQRDERRAPPRDRSAYGLTLRCSDTDIPCQRNTALAIWGGVGIVAIGTALGVMIVQIGQARVHARPAVFARIPGLLLDARF